MNHNPGLTGMKSATDRLPYPVGIACTRITLHKYDSGYERPGFLITSAHPTDILTFLVYHQPYHRPVHSSRPSRSPTTPGVRYIYAAEMIPYDPKVADPKARHYRHLKRLILQATSLFSGLTLKDTRTSWNIHPPGTALATPLNS